MTDVYSANMFLGCRSTNESFILGILIIRWQNVKSMIFLEWSPVALIGIYGNKYAEPHIVGAF
jgi:hypothetical protein